MSQTASTRVQKLSIRYMRAFGTSLGHFTSYSTQVGMSILFQPIGRHEQIMPSTRPPCSTGSLRHHANSIVPCLERRLRNGRASDYADPLSTARILAAASWTMSRHQQRLHSGARKSRLRCLSKLAAAAHAHSTQPVDGLRRAVKCCRRCRRPLSSCSHHLRANLPNA